MSIGARLREERVKLGLSQEAFAALAGVSKRVQLKWEKDETSPSAQVLAAFAEAGADLLYIVTGTRRDAPLGHWEPHHSVDSIEKTLTDPEAFAAREGISVDRMLAAARQTLEDIATSDREDVTEPTREKADNLLARHFNDEAAAKRRSTRLASLMTRRQHAGRDLEDALAAIGASLPRDLHHQLLMVLIDYQIDMRDVMPILGELSKLSPQKAG